MGYRGDILSIAPKLTYTTFTDLAGITIGRIRVDVTRARCGLSGLGSGVRIFLECRRRHRRWRPWMRHVGGLLGLGRALQRREHGDVTLPVVGPLRRWRGAINTGSAPARRYAPICAASTTLANLNGLKSSLMCTGGVFFNGRVPKKGLGGPCGVGLASDGLGLGEPLLEPFDGAP